MSASTANNNVNDDNNKDDIPNICANCGKGEESSISLKACTACKLVKYCNRECQIAHRSQHKKECKKRAKGLHDESLFRQPPPEYEDCPICFLRMPTLITGSKYMSCCGKNVCSGCNFAPVYDSEGNEITEDTCPFCRTPVPTCDKEAIERINKRVEVGDKEAIFNLGSYYFDGQRGYPQDYDKGLELWHYIGCSYDSGQGVTRDEKMAIHYWELAAMGGYVEARYNLGVYEVNIGSHERALKHFMIAVKDGESNVAKGVQELFKRGYATKDDYSKALRSYQEYLNEIKSDQRDKAAAALDTYKYI